MSVDLSGQTLISRPHERWQIRSVLWRPMCTISKYQSPPRHMCKNENTKKRRTHPLHLHPLPRLPLHHPHNLLLTNLITPRHHLPIQRPPIPYDPRNPPPNIPLIPNQCPPLPIPVYLRRFENKRIIEPSGRNAGERNLMPVPHIDDRIREVVLPDTLMHDFLFVAEG